MLVGLNEFLQVFGNVTVADIVKLIFIGIFLIFVYKQIKKFVDAKVSEEKQKLTDAQTKLEEEKALRKKIEEAYNITQKYPKYHQESIDIRKSLQDEIQQLRNALNKETQETEGHFEMIMRRLDEIENQNKKRECSKLRDMLLSNYRYYTNPQQNPSHSWTRMESEAFWELFREYEDAGGDGHMHSVVQPEMLALDVVDIGQR